VGNIAQWPAYNQCKITGCTALARSGYSDGLPVVYFQRSPFTVALHRYFLYDVFHRVAMRFAGM
jgi:hypothetical protein